MAITSKSVAQLYLAYLGRPEDAWGSLLYGGPDAVASDKLVHDFAYAPEAVALVANVSLAEQIDRVYLLLFNRDAEAAGLIYWQGEVQSGRLDIHLLPLAILQGAQNDDATAVANKLAAATAFVQHMDTAVEKTQFSGDAAALVARIFISQVTSDPATLTAALSGVDAALADADAVGQPPGVRFFLLTAAAHIDTISASPVPNTGFGVATSSGDEFVAAPIEGRPTIGNGDFIDGGLGVDTLAVTVDASDPSTARDTIVNVERAKLTISGSGSVDLSGVRDLQAVQVTDIGSDSGIVTISGVTTAQTVSLALDSGTAVTLDYADKGLPDQTLAPDLSQMHGILVLPGIEHVVIDAHLANNLEFDDITAPDAQTMQVTTSGFVSGSLRIAPTGTITIDSSGHLGGGISAQSVVVHGSVTAAFTPDSHVVSITTDASGWGTTVWGTELDDPSRMITIDDKGSGNLQVLGWDSLEKIVATGSASMDNFYGGHAADVFTGRGGDDNFVFLVGAGNTTGPTSAAELLALTDTITDFGAGDRLWCGMIYGAASHTGSAPGVAAIASGFASFDAADDTLLKKIAAVAAAVTPGQTPDIRAPYAIFADGGDAYVFISDQVAGISANDALVRLAGVPADPSHFNVIQDVIFGA